MSDKQTTRIEMRVPNIVLEAVEQYQKENLITNRTVAFLELVRKGLKVND